MLLTLFANCTQASIDENDSERVIEVLREGMLIRKEYFGLNNLLKSSVTFSDNNQPQDSIAFVYSTKNEFISFSEYQFKNGRYEKVNLSPSYNYYQGIFASVKECSDMYLSKNSSLLLKEFNDLCIIQSSVLADGREALSIRKKLQEGELTVYIFENMNSKFTNLSEEIESYFYDKTLLDLKIKFRGDDLIEETYTFENGIFSRIYSYEKNLKEKMLTVAYKGKSQQKFITMYRVRVCK